MLEIVRNMVIIASLIVLIMESIRQEKQIIKMTNHIADLEQCLVNQDKLLNEMLGVNNNEE